MEELRRCEIVVAGELSRRFQLAFDGMTVQTGGGRTTISGVVADRARLLGLIGRVEELGLDLLGLRVSPEEQAVPAGGTEPRPTGGGDVPEPGR
jgi:hypothetical protein